MITFPFTQSITHVSPVFTRRAVFTTFRSAEASEEASGTGHGNVSAFSGKNGVSMGCALITLKPREKRRAEERSERLYYESHNNCPRFSSRRPHFVLTLSSLRPHRGHFCNRLFTLLRFFSPVLFTFYPMNLHIPRPVPKSLPHSFPAPLSLPMSVYTSYFNFSWSDAYWVGGK